MFNAINVSWDPEAGYPDVAHGTSFIAAMTWAKRGCPVRQLSFVTYSESENQTLAARRRLHEGVLAQEVEPGPVLRRRHPRAGDDVKRVGGR